MVAGASGRRHETSTGRGCSSNRSRKVTTRPLSSSASIGGIVGGGSTKLGAKTTMSDLVVMRFSASLLATSWKSRRSQPTVLR